VKKLVFFGPEPRQVETPWHHGSGVPAEATLAVPVAALAGARQAVGKNIAIADDYWVYILTIINHH